jgi:hypothetical protein
MFETRERSAVEAGKLISILMIRNFPNQNWNPPLAPSVTGIYQIPGYTRFYEKMRTEKWTLMNENGSVNYWPNWRKKWKPFQHYKRWVEQPLAGSERCINWAVLSGTGLGSYVPPPGAQVSALLATDSNEFRSRFGAFGDHINGLLSLTDEDLVGKGFIPEPPGLSILVEHALKGMLPSAKQDMSLLNTIIELRDFKSLPRTLTNIERLIAKLGRLAQNVSHSNPAKPLAVLKATGQVIKRPVADLTKYKLQRKMLRIRNSFVGFGSTLREMLHASADGYLQKEFNVEPLLRDISDIFNAVVGVDKRLRRLIHQSGRVHMKHYDFNWQEVATQATELVTTSGYSLSLNQFAGSISPSGFTGTDRAHPLGFKATRRVTHYEPTKFHAQVEYRYYFTQYQLEHNQVLNMLDRMGLYAINPSVIWNAIPWSFIVDWVFGVSRWLKSRSVMNMEPTINISRFLWSWERHRRIATYVSTYQKGYNISPTIDTYLPTMFESTYRRDVSLPTISQSTIFGSGLNSKELSLGVALVITRRKRQTSRGR